MPIKATSDGLLYNLDQLNGRARIAHGKGSAIGVLCGNHARQTPSEHDVSHYRKDAP